MFNLPKELEEVVLSKVPLTSMRKVRLSCKNWNTLSKGKNFAKKQIGQAIANNLVVVMMDYRIYLMSINLQDNNIESCIQCEAKLISLDNSFKIDLSNIYHCEGLLLCIMKDYTKLVVWNPYWGQTRCIEPKLGFHRLKSYSHAIGYDKNNGSYKILTFIDWIDQPTLFVEIKIYDLNSDTWRNLDIPPPDGQIFYYHHGVSLKGDTYWHALEKHSEVNGAYLVSFDFTKERFGPLLPMPFEWYHPEDTVILSSVRDENLAVLYQTWDTLLMEIWITTEINPNAVSWSRKVFLEVDMRSLTNDFQFNLMAASFFIDEEKKVAVIFEKLEDRNPAHNVAFIIGVDGSLKQEFLGESPYGHCFPLACSYVPSLVQLN